MITKWFSLQIYYADGHYESTRPPAYLDFNTRKGNSKMLEISLNTRSMDNPMILNGRRINQMMGKSTISTSARGQHSTKRIHHNNRLISVFIIRFYNAVQNTKR
jgi:hypothetical protein